MGTAWCSFLRLDLLAPGPGDTVWAKGEVLLPWVHCGGGSWAGRAGEAPLGGQEVPRPPSRRPCRQLCSKWPVTRLMGCVNKHVCLGPPGSCR